MSCKPKATPGPKPPRQAQRPTADWSHFTPKVSRSFTAQAGEPSLWASTRSQAKCWHNPKLAPYLKDIEVMTLEWVRKAAVVQIRK